MRRFPATCVGESLKPLLEGTGRLRQRSVYSETLYAHYHFGWGELTAITDGRYRYIQAPREELYDLRTDPAQRDDLAGQDPAWLQTLRSFGAELRTSDGGPRCRCRPPQRQPCQSQGQGGGG